MEYGDLKYNPQVNWDNAPAEKGYSWADKEHNRLRKERLTDVIKASPVKIVPPDNEVVAELLYLGEFGEVIILPEEKKDNVYLSSKNVDNLITVRGEDTSIPKKYAKKLNLIETLEVKLRLYTGLSLSMLRNVKRKLLMRLL